MDLRALSSAIMSTVETAEQVVHDTELWLSGHQKFNDLDLVHSLISETEVRYGRTMCDTRSKNLFRMSSF